MKHEERRLKAAEIALQLGHSYHHGDREKIFALAEDIDAFALKDKPEEPKPAPQKPSRAARK